MIAVVGPTCVGKGALALALGEALGGPSAAAIISCDSVKIYRGADVGSAKISGPARRGFEFFLVDVASPGEVFSAARYMTEARAACARIWDRGSVALVVGGTGLYFRALLDGICAAPAADAAVRASLQARAAAGGDLFAYLKSVDAETAARLSAADAQRIIRALEVYETSGLPLSSFHRRGAAALAPDLLTIFALDGPRDWLAARVAARTQRLLAEGLRGETERILASGVVPAAPPLSAIGYKEMVGVITGTYGEETAAELITRNTRRLAKRQRTWFRAERRAVRLDATRGPEYLRDEILNIRGKQGVTPL